MKFKISGRFAWGERSIDIIFSGRFVLTPSTQHRVESYPPTCLSSKVTWLVLASLYTSKPNGLFIYVRLLCKEFIMFDPEYPDLDSIIHSLDDEV